MKRLIVCIIILILLCCSCAQSSDQNDTGTSSFTLAQIKFIPFKARLIVNKKDISDTATAFVYSDHYAVIPLIAVSKALGAEVKWESKTKAVITVNGDKYILDTAKHELYNDKADPKDYNEYFPKNYFEQRVFTTDPANRYHKQIDEEYYVDNYSVMYFLSDIGEGGYFEINLSVRRVIFGKEESEPDIYGEFSVEDYSQEIQSKADELEKDTLSDEEQNVYLRNYGDLTTVFAVKHEALGIFEQLYGKDYYTKTDVRVYRDQLSSCWLVKTKSIAELWLCKKDVPFTYLYTPEIEEECTAIFTDDGKLLFANSIEMVLEADE